MEGAARSNRSRICDWLLLCLAKMKFNQSLYKMKSLTRGKLQVEKVRLCDSTLVLSFSSLVTFVTRSLHHSWGHTG